MSEHSSGHQCEGGHDWIWIKDWYGDPSIPNGTVDCSRWECRVCGEVGEDMEPPARRRPCAG
jgi:hypothetical protein